METDGRSLNQSQVIVRPPAYWGTEVWNFSYRGDETGGITIDNDVEIDLLHTTERAVALLRELSRLAMTLLNAADQCCLIDQHSDFRA